MASNLQIRATVIGVVVAIFTLAVVSTVDASPPAIVSAVIGATVPAVMLYWVINREAEATTGS